MPLASLRKKVDNEFSFSNSKLRKELIRCAPEILRHKFCSLESAMKKHFLEG